jgi:hypothetical protein
MRNSQRAVLAVLGVWGSAAAFSGFESGALSRKLKVRCRPRLKRPSMVNHGPPGH